MHSTQLEERGASYHCLGALGWESGGPDSPEGHRSSFLAAGESTQDSYGTPRVK